MLTKLQSVITGKKQDTYGKYLLRDKVSERQLEVMYDIYKEYYHNTNFELFKTDFSEKEGVILILESETNQIVGFSTVTIKHLKNEGLNYRFIFSGDTVILKRYWGSRALHTTMFRVILKTRLTYPLDQVYWMLISKGYKTYLLLANNYYVYYPHAKGKHQHLASLVESYCESFYSEYFDKNTGLLNFGDDYQPLKGEIAPITTEMRNKNSKINFFERMNPTWEKGTELPCIGRLAWIDIARYPLRILRKPVSQSKLEVNLKPNNLVIG